MKKEHRQLTRGFATLFNALWYRDFPMAATSKPRASRAELTTHIATCARGVADLLGFFTHFETGKRTDAVIKNAFGESVARIEWEYAQPNHKNFNELHKLRESHADANVAVLITYSRNEFHEQNMRIIHKEWGHCATPLLLFLVRYRYAKGRQFGNLETHLIHDGKTQCLMSQPALPWKAEGTRWWIKASDAPAGTAPDDGEDE